MSRNLAVLCALVMLAVILAGCAGKKDVPGEKIWYSEPVQKSEGPGWKKKKGHEEPGRHGVTLIIGETEKTRQLNFEIFRTFEGTQFGADDIDEDGKTEWIVARDNEITVMNADGQKRWSSVFNKPVKMFLIRDIDAVQGAELAGCCGDGSGNSEIFVLSHDGRKLESIPVPVRGEDIEVTWVGSLDGTSSRTILARMTSHGGRQGLLAFDYQSSKEKWHHMPPGLAPGPLCVSDPDRKGRRKILATFGPPDSRNQGSKSKPHGVLQTACLSPEGALLWNLKLGTSGIHPDYKDIEGKGRKELLIFSYDLKKKPFAGVHVVNPEDGRVRASFGSNDESEFLMRALQDRENEKDPQELSLKDKCLRAMDSAFVRAGLEGDAWIEKGRGDICGDSKPERLLADSRVAKICISDFSARPLWEGAIPEGPAADGAVADLDNDGVMEFFVRSGTHMYLFRRTGGE